MLKQSSVHIAGMDELTKKQKNAIGVCMEDKKRNYGNNNKD
ncbi:MAG: hypothetical protein ACE5ES_01805 [Candidatus Nanoarchaeia archaeon]